MAAAAICVALAVPAADAQRASPHETHEFVVDGATITIAYGRPSMRGRKIFGALIPYNKVWMPGADEATVFETTAALQFADFKLPAGRYSLYTMPSDKQWALIINKKTGQWHTLYVPAEDIVKLPMTSEELASPVEQLTISAVPHPPGGAIRLEWENTRFSVPFTVVH
jgi:Protein of unknown function (DUF2911)